LLAAILIATMSLIGCGKEKAEDETKALIARVLGSTTASVKPEPTFIKWTKMPEITVDDLGVYIGGRRADPSSKKDQRTKRLAKLVDNLPVNKDSPKPVTVAATKNCETQDVAALIYELGRVGVAEVIVKTDSGRPELFKTADGKTSPMQLTIVPETRLHKPDKCSIVATTTTDGATKVWDLEGGTAMKHKPGFAGPDLTRTGEVIAKKIAACKSKTAFFSADPEMEWKYAFNMGATILQVDEKKQIDKLVLPAALVIAGQPVKLRE